MATMIENNIPKNAGQLAHWDLVTFTADTRLTQAALVLGQHKISGAPVLDALGHVLGVITLSDIAKAVGTNDSSARGSVEYYSEFWVERPALEMTVPVKVTDQTVWDVMNHVVYQVQAEDSLDQVVSVMQAAHIHRVLVRDGTKRLGILSNSDLVSAIPAMLQALALNPAPVS